MPKASHANVRCGSKADTASIKRNIRFVAKTDIPAGSSDGQSSSLSQRGVEDAVDLHDIVVKQTLSLDHRARRIWRLGPEFRLRLVHHGRETVQVADINGQPHTILQARPLRLRNQPDVEQCLTNAGLRILHQLVCRRINALHSGHKDEVAGVCLVAGSSVDATPPSEKLLRD